MPGTGDADLGEAEINSRRNSSSDQRLSEFCFRWKWIVFSRMSCQPQQDVTGSMPNSRLMLIAFAVAISYTIPFVLRGYYGDDVQFHVDSWIGMRQAWLSGNFLPGWDSLANFTLGDPRFCFYPPMSLYLGGLLSLMLPLRLAPAALVILAVLLAGVSMFIAAKEILGRRYALLAAFLYMINPYLLVNAITRYAIAELLVQAWLPLIVLNLIRASANFDRRSIMWLACLLSLSWLTDLPASVALMYGLLLAVIIESIRIRSLTPLVSFSLAEVISLLATSFYLIPAFVEKGWISISALWNKVLPYHGFFYALVGRSNLQIGVWVIAFVEAVVIIIAFVMHRTVARKQQFLLYELGAVAFAFQLPFAGAVWDVVPELHVVQFPYRFLSIIGAIVPLTILGKDAKPRFTLYACAILFLLALLPPIFYLRNAPGRVSRLPDLDSSTRAGYRGWDEYVPAGGRMLSAPSFVPRLAVAEGSCDARLLPSSPYEKRVGVDTDAGCSIRLGNYYYPLWKATDEWGRPLVTSRDHAGLLLVRVPRGRHSVQVRFSKKSIARTISKTGSLMGIFLLTASMGPIRLRIFSKSRNS